MNPELKARIIKTFEPIIEQAMWREDEVRNGMDSGSTGGYSHELTNAINLLEEIKRE
ncbi:hypothetical protein LCGC14_0743330 [marine sediment metagenome]|uniref:Uncharacterized protein n=1 Tax=marine sediment metagenome TaxID=412755 RepID=A0A0F9QR72_9ZZZZ